MVLDRLMKLRLIVLHLQDEIRALRRQDLRCATQVYAFILLIDWLPWAAREQL